MPLLFMLLCGCTVVSVHSENSDDVEIERGFGFVSLTTRPLTGAVVVEARSVGLVRTDSNFTFGYMNQTVAAVPPDTCRAIFWVKDIEAAKAVESLVREQGGDLCVVRTPSSKE